VEPISQASPRFVARIAGVFYLLTFVTGAVAQALIGRHSVVGDGAGLIATACYVIVTLLFYPLFRVVGRRISLLAAVIGLVGCTWGALTSFHLAPFHINSLVFFGFYCLLIGYLILRSTFLPHVLGVLMAFAGCGWLTFASPGIAHALAPYNLVPGLLGEGSLTLWLLVMGVNIQRWDEQAAAAVVPSPAGGQRAQDV
jgi:Domain of unknown function (DUF4386)